MITGPIVDSGNQRKFIFYVQAKYQLRFVVDISTAFFARFRAPNVLQMHLNERECKTALNFQNLAKKVIPTDPFHLNPLAYLKPHG